MRNNHCFQLLALLISLTSATTLPAQDNHFTSKDDGALYLAIKRLASNPVAAVPPAQQVAPAEAESALFLEDFRIESEDGQ